MIKKGRNAFCGILSLGNRIGGVNPSVASKLYWSTVIPSMMYGCQVLCLSDCALEQLEVEHRAYGKRFQSLPVTTANPAAYSLLGWSSIHAYYDLSVLTFFYKILHMRASCVYRKLVTNLIIDIVARHQVRKGPTAIFVQIRYKYNLFDYVRQHIDTGEGIPPLRWKSLCKEAIKSHEVLVHCIELNMCSKLKCMVNVKIGMHQWWQVARAYPQSLPACRFMIRLLVGEEPLEWNTGRFIRPRSMQNRMCKVCDTGAFGTVKHFMFECKELDEPRHMLNDTVTELCPYGKDIMLSRNSDAIISAALDVGADYRLKLEKIASKVYEMFKIHQVIQKTRLVSE